jgi:hypothetical protein
MISIPFTTDYEPWARGQRNLRWDRAMAEALLWGRDQLDDVTRREIMLNGGWNTLVFPEAARRLLEPQS